MDKDSGANTGPRLRRSLTLWDLILYGAIVLQPVAPMSAFGALSDRGRGHVVTAVLIAMVAMLCTAFSYGKMASVYPSAGSAFTYVAQEIHSSAGYITGWSMVMDYIVNPLICTIWCAGQAHEFAPGIPVWGWKIFFAVVFTLLNLQGIKTSARLNAGLAAANPLRCLAHVSHRGPKCGVKRRNFARGSLSSCRVHCHGSHLAQGFFRPARAWPGF